MPDFIREDLFGARFEEVDLTGARFRTVDLTGVKISGALLVDMDISGDVEHVLVNGVDVAPLVEAELNRRYPDRAKMRPGDAAGYREPESFPVRRRLGAILNEEREHRFYAERDLAVLESQGTE
jgi:uncharacterized protein YjbI with pentapeptide repeats